MRILFKSGHQVLAVTDRHSLHLSIYEKKHQTKYERFGEFKIRYMNHEPGWMELWVNGPGSTRLTWGVVDGRTCDHSKHIRKINGVDEQKLDEIDARIADVRKTLYELEDERKKHIERAFKSATELDDTSIPAMIEEAGGTVQFK